jgi:exodeoxyribonuclease-3
MKIFKYLAMFCIALLVFCKQGNAQKASKSNETIKILSYNVMEGFRNSDSIKIAFKNWVAELKPDVIAFQELNKFKQGDFKKFAADLGFPYAELLKESGFPVGIASRFPLSDVKKVTAGMQHGYMYAKILGYHFFVTHLAPDNFNKRKQEMEVLKDALKAIPATENTLIMGDFNNMSPLDSTDYNNSPEKMRLLRASEANHPGTAILNKGKIDYSSIQTLLDMGFYDSWRMFHTRYEKSAPTKMKTHHNFTRIDYIWVNGALKNACISSELIKDNFTDYLSDHYPMVLVLKK